MHCARDVTRVEAGGSRELTCIRWYSDRDMHEQWVRYQGPHLRKVGYQRVDDAPVAEYLIGIVIRISDVLLLLKWLCRICMQGYSGL